MNNIEIMPYYSAGKKIRHISWNPSGWIALIDGAYTSNSVANMTPFYYLYALSVGWGLYVEPKKKIELAPALGRGSHYWISSTLYLSEEAARKDLKSAFVRWPAIPGEFVEVEE